MLKRRFLKACPMQNAMKAKQTVDAAQCDALEHAVEDMSKMYLPAEPSL